MNRTSSLSQSSSTSLLVSSGSGTGAFSSSFLRTDQFSGSIKQGWDYSIRGRLGTLVTPWSLLYLRVCPGTSSGITKFSEHEAD